MRALPGWQVEQVRVYPVPYGLVARYQAGWVDRQGALHQVAGGLRFTFEGTRIGEVRGGAANLATPLWERGRSAGSVLEGQARRQAERSRTLPTLRATLEGISRRGLWRIVDKQGVIWSAEELLEWLEWQAPEQLRLPVTFVSPTRERDGAIYALGRDQDLLSGKTLYRVQCWMKPLFYHLDHPRSQE